jgi:predicted CXXCH cytochrome family protein
MKKTVIALLIIVAALVGCARDWKYVKIENIMTEHSVPGPQVCSTCHERAYEAWNENRHSDPERMERVGVKQLRECGACHSNLGLHVEAPSDNTPPKVDALSKTEQNKLCGKCHFNKDVFGRKAIYPHGRHGVFMSVGFDESRKRQLSCLDCHSGHSRKADMLQNITAHICFRCHKEAIVTMGVFQPLNYVGGGKVCTACHAEHGDSGGRQAARALVGMVAVCAVCHI